jgi:hypothetical protein
MEGGAGAAMEGELAARLHRKPGARHEETRGKVHLLFRTDMSVLRDV